MTEYECDLCTNGPCKQIVLNEILFDNNYCIGDGSNIADFREVRQRNKKLKMEITIDFTKAPKNVGYENQFGNIQYTFGHWEDIEKWISGILTGATPDNSKVTLIWKNMPDWLALNIGVFLAPKVHTIVIKTQKNEFYYVKR